MAPSTIVLTGRDLSVADVVAVARDGVPVTLSDDARLRMRRSRAVVDRLLDARVKVYGLTTGFGSKKNVFIEPSETRQLQSNLIRSHACGVGDPLPEDVVRATILLRANTLARGLSGIRVEVVETVLQLLDKNIFPLIPSKGSLGASGDLAPLSHLALVLMGDPAGMIFDPDRAKLSFDSQRHHSDRREKPRVEEFVSSTPERLRSLGIEPVSLEAKEGLALNNGTQVMTAVGMLTIFDARNLVACSEGTCAMSFEALSGVTDAFRPELHAARPHAGQSTTAAALRRHTKGSQILRLPVNMAFVNAAVRALGNARFHLDRGISPLTDDIAQNVVRTLDTIEALQKDPEAPLQNADPRDPLSGLTLWRAALGPIKRDVLSIYRAMLTASLPLESQEAQAELAVALDSLERAVPAMPAVQDSYSLRCAPQVIGAARTAIDHVESVLVTEANSVTDNPLIFPPEVDEDGNPLPLDDPEAYRAALGTAQCRRAVCSGGNFHGEPVALVMDYLSTALSEIANISERRTAHMIDGHLNQGLPSLLIHEAGLNSGFMIPQYTAAALVSENKSLAHPASVDSIPSCENTEDHVSMGTIAARKAREILLNAEQVIGIELLTAFQALHFHQPLRPGQAAKRLTALLEDTGITFVATDRPLYPDMDRAVGLIRSGTLRAVLEKDPT